LLKKKKKKQKVVLNENPLKNIFDHDEYAKIVKDLPKVQIPL